MSNEYFDISSGEIVYEAESFDTERFATAGENATNHGHRPADVGADPVGTAAALVASEALARQQGDAVLTETLAGKADSSHAHTPAAVGADPAGTAVGLVAAESAARQQAIQAAIDGLLAGAPGALDTLNELASALGDDANFAATVTAALAARALAVAGEIRGQFDTMGSTVCLDQATAVALDYNAGNAYYIDASAITGGKVLTINIANWPGAGKFAAMTIAIKCGAAAPSVTWPTGWSGLVPAAGKTSEYTARSLGAAGARVSLGEAY